jgi:hypothetical protein
LINQLDGSFAGSNRHPLCRFFSMRARMGNELLCKLPPTLLRIRGLV